jgi:RHS repeat-associated protein
MNISGLTDSPVTTTKNKYLYNGKEMQDDFGLNWLDYGARFYDAQIGRWHSQDNYSEEFSYATPYSYVLNEPISYLDPDGNFRFKFVARLYSFVHGGEVLQSKKSGEYFVGRQVKYTGPGNGAAYKRAFNWAGDGEAEVQEQQKNAAPPPKAIDLMPGGSGMQPFCPECPPPTAGPSMGDPGYQSYRLGVIIFHKSFHKNMESEKEKAKEMQKSKDKGNKKDESKLNSEINMDKDNIYRNNKKENNEDKNIR